MTTKPVERMSKEELIQEVYRLSGLINNPHVDEFLGAVRLESAFQRTKWDDENKTAWDWFWTCGYLCQKAASAALSGDHEKALHHTISTAALMGTWYRRMKVKHGDQEEGNPDPFEFQ
jgi:hypothetical protein